MSTEHIRFELTEDDLASFRDRTRESLAGADKLALLCVVLYLGYTAYALIENAKDRITTMMFAVAGVLWVFNYLIMKRGGFYARSGDLVLNASGFHGTLEGKNVVIPWSAIAEVHRLPAGIVITRRTFGRVRLSWTKTIVIPKRATGDGGASLWAELERRLIAGRGVVRSTITPNEIVNTAS